VSGAIGRVGREAVGDEVRHGGEAPVILDRAKPSARVAATGNIAIVVPYSRLDTIPFLCDLGEHLVTRGYSVDIFGNEEAGTMPPTFSSDRIRLRALRGFPGQQAGPAPGERSKRRGVVAKMGSANRLPGVPRARRAISRVQAALIALDTTRPLRWRRTAHLPYQVVIGVDAEGLVAAASLGRITKAALVYYSLELLPTWDLTSRSERVLKWREARSSRQAALVVVQDPSRGRILAKDNGIDPAKFVYAPNAPSGAARRERSQWWHEQFTLPADRRVLLHTGSLGFWTGVDKLVKAAAELPAEWVLVVHSNHRPGDSALINQLRSGAPAGKVFFSDSPVQRQDYRALLDGADAGVAFYIPQRSRWTMTNITTLGLASGKFSYYLWCGLPVVVNSATSLGQLVERERVGIQIDSAAGLGKAVSSIAADYDRFSARAVQYFNAELDFTASAERIGRAVDELTRSSPLLPAQQIGRT
jgi:glycosyltransferase involved in cell wall biosynthesis